MLVCPRCKAKPHFLDRLWKGDALYGGYCTATRWIIPFSWPIPDGRPLPKVMPFPHLEGNPAEDRWARYDRIEELGEVFGGREELISGGG